MHLNRSLSSLKLFPAIILLMSAAFSNISYSQDFHGAAILKNPVGPDGTANAHVGDPITATITVMNLDDFGDTVTITNILDIIHHAGGDVPTGNLLLAPNTITRGSLNV